MRPAVVRVNWPRRILTIARSLTVIGGVATEGQTKTHPRRGVALDDAMLALLEKRRADQGAYARHVGVDPVPDPLILSSSADGGQPYQPDTLTDYYKRAAKRLGITTHFHELRHFAATTAFRGWHRRAHRRRAPGPRHLRPERREAREAGR